MKLQASREEVVVLHHQVMTLGLRAERWRLFAELLDVEFVRV